MGTAVSSLLEWVLCSAAILVVRPSKTHLMGRSNSLHKMGLGCSTCLVITDNSMSCPARHLNAITYCGIISSGFYRVFYIAAAVLIGIGLVHSILGERYILIRLFRRADLPVLFDGTEFTQNTLRFAWHLTTLAWWGFAAILVHLAQSPPNTQLLGNLIAITFLAHFLVALYISKGRHLSWIGFLIVGLVTVFASNT